MEQKNLAFGKLNYILIVVSLILIVLGFGLMAGSGSTEAAFNADIFSKTRIVVAPFIVFMGFLLVIVAILVKKKGN
jgi:uncharacterized membrane protein